MRQRARKDVCFSSFILDERYFDVMGVEVSELFWKLSWNDAWVLFITVYSKITDKKILLQDKFSARPMDVFYNREIDRLAVFIVQVDRYKKQKSINDVVNYCVSFYESFDFLK